MGLGQRIEDAVYICEEVSRLEFKGGLFYLSDDLGVFTLTRVMRPSTFLKCVKGAYALAMQYELGQRDNVVPIKADH